MSRFANLGLIFTSPTTVGRNVMEDPHWVIPLVVVLAVACITTIGTYEYQVKFQREFVGEVIQERNPDADLDEIFAVTTGKQVRAGVGAVVFGGVVLLVFAAVLKGAAAVAGGKVGFRRIFAFVSYSAVISALGSLVRVPLVLAKGSVDVRTSLAAFAPSMDLKSPAAVILGSFDIFAVWQVVAVCFGFSLLAGLGMKKSSGIVIGLWAILIVIRVGLAMLPGLAGGSQ
jgi:hypothetical protein